MEFTYDPIKDIFSEISKMIYENKNNMFNSYIVNLEKGDYENAWALAVAENSFGLSKEDIEIITGFGKLLGKTDLNGQLNEIGLADEFLDKQILDAEEVRKKNDRLYKSLGIIIGITIVIVFL